MSDTPSHGSSQHPTHPPSRDPSQGPSHGHAHGTHGAHGHHHHFHGLEEGQATSALLFVLLLNLAFACIEVGGSYWTGSLSVFADALHDFGDVFALGFALWMARVAQQKPSATLTYGHARRNVFSALFLGAVLLLSSGFVIKEAIGRLQSPSEPYGLGMLLLSILGISVNGWAALRMRGHKGVNQEMIRLHLLEDCVGWACVLVGSIFIITLKWYWVDPVLAIALSGLILKNVVMNLRRTFSILSQAVPDGFSLNTLRTDLLKIEGLKNLHDLHFWTLDGEKHIVTLHAVCDANASASLIKQKIRHHLSHIAPIHATIEIETETEVCEIDCLPEADRAATVGSAKLKDDQRRDSD